MNLLQGLKLIYHVFLNNINYDENIELFSTEMKKYRVKSK